jgi:peptidoglycan/xylan/chitin deacetylase (PgdA/CDA1 family)
MMVVGTVRGFRAARHGIVYAAPRRRLRREIGLTFDDGPSSEWTPAILDLLRAHDARATFFILGASVAGREEILRRTAAEGHELGNHLFTHSDPATLADEDLRTELEQTSILLERVVGSVPELFRPPYAETDFRVAKVARRAGFAHTVLRSVDPADWETDDADLIAERVLSGAGRGSIVCLHDALPPEPLKGSPTRQPTVDALARVVPELGRRGYRLVTVSELIGRRRR